MSRYLVSNKPLVGGLPFCKLQIGVLLDGSDNMRDFDYYNVAVPFVAGLTASANIGVGKSRAALVHFAAYPELKWSMTKYNEGPAMQAELATIKKKGGHKLCTRIRTRVLVRT